MIHRISQKLKHQPLSLVTICILTVFSVLPWNYGIIYQLLFSQMILPNVQINNIQIGGKNINTAADLVIAELRTRPQHLLLQFAGMTFTINEYDIEGQYDINATITNAYQIGRNQTIVGNLLTHIGLLESPQSVPLQFTYNADLLDLHIASIAAQMNIAEIPALVQIIEVNQVKTASVSAGTPGVYLNIVSAKEQIIQAFSHQDLSPIPLPLEKTSVLASMNQIDKVKRVAQNIIGKQIKLSHAEDVWILSDLELVNFLDVDQDFEETKLATWSAQLAEVVNRPPVEPLFEFNGNKVVEFKASLPGITLDEVATMTQIKSAITTLSSNQETEYIIQLPVKEQPSTMTTEKVNNLGIKELIGKGESWFSHSIPGRVHNVGLSASKIHGTLVAPGEEFSFVKTVGAIDAAHGYQQAYVIQNGQTVLGDGGGVCQTSTTLFRAALDAGLNITERYAHAYRVDYYEQKYQVGVDATIFSPSVDFKFINDTSHHILIQTYVDKANYYARFEIYGTKDGRVATVSDSKIWNQTAPPPDRYQDDPTLPPGVVRQVDWKAWGANTSFDWKVEKDGIILHEKTFYSTYRPWQAVYLRGV